jgi:ADP-ribose pyrophosphatase YjhB (NUDIX family)
VSADLNSGVPVVCVGAVCLDQGRLLLVRRAHDPGKGAWSVPGGRVEAGETLPEAVVRELEEETALEGVCDRLVGYAERMWDGHHFVILDFAVTVPSPQEPTPGSDASEARWVSLGDVRRMNLVAGLRTFLEEHGVLLRDD